MYESNGDIQSEHVHFLLPSLIWQATLPLVIRTADTKIINLYFWYHVTFPFVIAEVKEIVTVNIFVMLNNMPVLLCCSCFCWLCLMLFYFSTWLTGIGYLPFQSTLPVLENPFSKKVRSIIDMLHLQRSRYMKVKMLIIHSSYSPLLLLAKQVMLTLFM